MPYTALTAPTVMITSMTVRLRRPWDSRYAIGMISKQDELLGVAQADRRIHRKTAATSVAPPYAASGQNMRGTSMRSRRRTTTESHSTPVMASSAYAAAIDTCGAAAKPSSDS